MSTAGWDPGAVGTAVIEIVTFAFMAKTAIALGYRYASDYVYKIRFPESTSVLQRSLNDADISQVEYLYRNIPPPDSLPMNRGPFSHYAYGNCWKSFPYIFNVLKMPVRRRLPWNLSQLPLKKDYFLTDAQTIFICLLGVGVKPLHFSEDNGTGVQTCRWDSRICATFRRQNSFCFAHVQFFQFNPYHLYYRRNIGEYRRIIVHGYPPWYQTKVTNTAKVMFEVPSLEKGNLKRAGWIVAIGLGDLDDPLPYFSTKLGRFDEYGDASYRHHRGGTGAYYCAFTYLQEVIRERFTLDAFTDPEDQNIVATAGKEIEDMIRHDSASGAGKFLRQCPQLAGASNDGTFAEQLSSSETALAIELFNHKRPLDAGQISFVKHKIKPIIAGALRGLKSLFVYFNDCDIQIPAGVQKMIDDNPQIYLEGCQL
jgi:hypothetical protein